MARLDSGTSAAKARHRRVFWRFVSAYDHGVSHAGLRAVPPRYARPQSFFPVAARDRLARDADTAAGSGGGFDPTGLNTPQLGFPYE
jgi:hypothetical protein